MVDRPEISTSEWQVMNVVWDNQPTTASEIIKLLSPNNDWTPATIRTFLHRLVKKGALKFEQDGNRYLYRAAISRSSSVKRASHSFLASVFAGETGPLLAHFVRSSRLSEVQIQELRDLLEEKDAKK